MKQLPVTLQELIDIFDMGFQELHHYLDTETGQVVMVIEEIRDQLETLYEGRPGILIPRRSPT